MQISAAPSAPVQASPALRFTQDYAWLTEGEHSPITGLVPEGPDSVRVMVRDSWSVDAPEEEHQGMTEMVADAAAGMLEQAVDGVRLVVGTDHGYEGRPTWFTGDENYFATGLPGVQSQVIESRYDVDGDGTVGDDEAAYLFQVDTAERADKLDTILRDEYGRYPVRFHVTGE